jgi:hypothetical protein
LDEQRKAAFQRQSIHPPRSIQLAMLLRGLETGNRIVKRYAISVNIGKINVTNGGYED